MGTAGTPPAPARVVVCCTPCQRAWKPDPRGWPEPVATGCPDCGGWTWIGELGASAAAGGGAR